MAGNTCNARSEETTTGTIEWAPRADARNKHVNGTLGMCF